MSFGPKTCCPEECAKARQSAARCKSSRTARNRIQCRREETMETSSTPETNTHSAPLLNVRRPIVNLGRLC